jgi:hypothetical protein
MAALAAASSVLVAAPAGACRIGEDRVFFDAAPKPMLPRVASIRVRLVNSGETFSAWERRLAYSAGARKLIGVAQLSSGRGGWFPVYAAVTSCTHGFFGRPGPLDMRGFLVGRFARGPRGERVFHAAGDWNGRWHF